MGLNMDFFDLLTIYISIENIKKYLFHLINHFLSSTWSRILNFKKIDLSILFTKSSTQLLRHVKHEQIIILMLLP